MSSARKRRADIQSNPPAPNKIIPPTLPGQNTTSNNVTPSNGLTLQQVIHIMDKRLSSLENSIQKGTIASTETKTSLDKDIVNEIYSRFDILLTEVADLKDIVMKLQSYTMDVNRILFEERSKCAVDEDTVVEEENADEDEKTDNNEDDSTVVENNTSDIKVNEPVEDTASTNKKRAGGGRRVRGGGIHVNL